MNEWNEKTGKTEVMQAVSKEVKPINSEKKPENNDYLLSIAFWLTVVIAIAIALGAFQMWVALVVYIVIIGALLAWLLYFGANDEKQTTTIATGEMKFVVQGESCKKVLANLKGTDYHYDDKTGLVVPDSKENPPYYPLSIFGVYWVSAIYPIRQIHVYPYVWDKLRDGDLKKGEQRYIIERHDIEPVNSLYLFYTYPILVEGIEVGGNLKINILLNITYRIVDPIKVVFVLHAKWPQLVSGSVEGAVTTYARNMGVDAFRKEDKDGGDSLFSKAIKAINEDSENMPGIRNNYGVVVHAVDYINYEQVFGSPEEQEAVTAHALAKLQADADEERARGITTIATAEATAFESQLSVLHKYGAKELLGQRYIAAAIEKFTGGTLSLGGNMALAIGPETKKQSTNKEKDDGKKS